MRITSLIIGAALMLVGSGAYILTGEPPTLITLAFGMVLVIMAIGAANPRWAGPVQLMSAGLTFMGMMSAASSLPRFFELVSGGEVEQQGAVISTGILGIFCVIHVTMSIRWILANKRSAKS